MLHRVMSVCFWFGSDRPGFCLGTSLLTTLMLLLYAAGIQASLSLGPGGDFPRLRGNCVFISSHISELKLKHIFGFVRKKLLIDSFTSSCKLLLGNHVNRRATVSVIGALF